MANCIVTYTTLYSMTCNKIYSPTFTGTFFIMVGMFQDTTATTALFAGFTI